jgi:hypothetical protein
MACCMASFTFTLPSFNFSGLSVFLRTELCNTLTLISSVNYEGFIIKINSKEVTCYDEKWIELATEPGVETLKW